MPTETPTLPRSSVLIVDDEPNMRTTLRDILQDEGYETATAATGEEAVQMCRRRAYDVILMDVRMPGMNGVEAFREIRRDQAGARVILMTAHSVDELKHLAIEEGAVAFLPKPLNVEGVLELISDVKSTPILVVENDAETATTLCEALRGCGYRVRVTGSPHSALGLVEQIRFDVIFIDAQLPAMNGLELYLAIKRITPTATAIMLAGAEAASETIASEAVRRTAYAVLRKPVDIDEILHILERVCGHRASNAVSKPATEQG
ncbi:MAG: response regulator [bacterium]|nr:response regulator [bacterium]